MMDDWGRTYTDGREWICLSSDTVELGSWVERIECKKRKK